MIYGVTDIANIEKLENAPPEIISINPTNPLVFEPLIASNCTTSTPGTVIKHPNLNTIINTNVYNNLFLTSGVFNAFFIVLNN